MTAIAAEFSHLLTEALARVQAADATAVGTVDGAVLEMRTRLTIDEAAPLLFGLALPRGFKWEWTAVAGEDEGQ